LETANSLNCYWVDVAFRLMLIDWRPMVSSGECRNATVVMFQLFCASPILPWCRRDAISSRNRRVDNLSFSRLGRLSALFDLHALWCLSVLTPTPPRSQNTALGHTRTPRRQARHTLADGTRKDAAAMTLAELEEIEDAEEEAIMEAMRCGRGLMTIFTGQHPACCWSGTICVSGLRPCKCIHELSSPVLHSRQSTQTGALSR